MRDAGFPLLTFIIFTPLAGAVLVAVLPRRRPEVVRVVGYVATAATMGFVGYLLYTFDTSASGYQLVENHPWIDTLGVRYLVGVDGISLFMVALTALLFPIGLIASQTISERLKSYTMWMLVLESALLGVFLSLDLILFFVFFEIVLVPMYFIIAGWGHDRRVYAALKFYLYTALGSAFLLVGLLTLAFLHGQDHALTFDVRTLTAWAPGGLSDGDGQAVVPRVLRRLRGQGASLPAAHLAARRPHRGPDGGVRDPGRRAAEDGHVRVPALLAAAVPRRQRVLRADAPGAGDDRDHLRRRRRGDATEPETTDRVLVGRATSASSCSGSSRSPPRASRVGCSR